MSLDMPIHGASGQERADLALYVFGLLEPAEVSRVAEHLQTGCRECEEELRRLEQDATALALTAPLEHPSAALRERVLALARKPAAIDLHVVRKGEGRWRPVAPGVSVRRLYVDRENGTLTVMMRMEPGATYAAHHHAGVEQCLVLEGDVSDGRERLEAGDFQCAPAGSDHPTLRTEAGCLLLLVASLRDHAAV